MKKLYTEAWDSWVMSWKMAGIEASYMIDTCWHDDSFEINLYVYVRKQLHIHKITGITEDETWEAAVSDLLAAGTHKIYESTVEMIRNGDYLNVSARKLMGDQRFPKTPYEKI